MKFRAAGDREFHLRGNSSGADIDGIRLIHVTSVGPGEQIIKDGQFTTRLCDTFNENLTYFFALRPAYKLKGADEKQSLLHYFPFVFVLKIENLPTPYHVYPFDTGGAATGAFDRAASHWLYLDDFELENGIQGCANHIAWAFNDRLDYYEGTLRSDLTTGVPDWKVGIYAYNQIARLAQRGNNQPDLRASSVEIAYKENIPIRGTVELVIVPKNFLEDTRGKNKKIIDLLKKNGIKWQLYDWQPNQRPSDFHVKINQIVKRHLLKVKAL
ncbi:hypothetical protein [Methylorubrum populi]